MPNDLGNCQRCSLRFMGGRSMLQWRLCGYLLILLSTAVPVAAQGTFQTIDVPGAEYTYAYGINNTGDVVGEWGDALGNGGGFLYSGGDFTTINVPGSLWTNAVDINDNGQVVGTFTSSAFSHVKGYLFSAGDYTTIDIGTCETIVSGINNNGDIVGWYSDNVAETCILHKGFVRTAGGAVTQVTFEAGAEYTLAMAINDSGVIVGATDTGQFRWVNGTATNITSECPASVSGINNAGAMVGGGSKHVIICADDSVIASDVPALGNTGGGASGINDDNTVVGTYGDASFNAHGFIYTPPRLKLFLDVNEDFDDMDPMSDIDEFVPGSDLSGASLNVPEPGSPIQEVRLIAAYIDSEGDIVEPVGQDPVDFSFLTKSAFAGIAMNAPDSRDTLGGPYADDFTLSSSARAFGADNIPNAAVVTLRVWDYGGFAKLRAERGEERTSPLRVPKDADDNMIPDGGWQTAQGAVPGTGSESDDVDQLPLGNGTNGDGLSRYEEYRGFVVTGVHLRTSPVNKDVFAFTEFMSEGVGDARTLSPDLVIHEIFESEQSGQKIAPNYLNTGDGGDIPGHFKAMRLGVEKEQQAILIYRNETLTVPAPPPSGCCALASTDGQGGLGPPWTIGPGKAAIFMKRLRKFSPTHSDELVGDAVDSEKLMQTIAHEFGHHLAIDDWPHPEMSPGVPMCPPEATTVMVTKYFLPTTNSNDCAWNNIPHTFDANSADLNQMQVR